MSLRATSSQTVGPFFSIGMAPLYRTTIATADTLGKRIRIYGRVIDGRDRPVPDAILETWQADPDGFYHHPADDRPRRKESAWFGFGRAATDPEGRFEFVTVKPGRVPAPTGELQAPHLVVAVFMRGLLKQVMTRIYFEDEPANNEDVILKIIPQERRHTVLARRRGTEAYEWNVHMQGDNETVFLSF